MCTKEHFHITREVIIIRKTILCILLLTMLGATGCGESNAEKIEMGEKARKEIMNQTADYYDLIGEYGAADRYRSLAED